MRHLKQNSYIGVEIPDEYPLHVQDAGCLVLLVVARTSSSSGIAHPDLKLKWLSTKLSENLITRIK